jgi:hypothetical protein
MSGTPVKIFLTSGSSWTVPSNWNSRNNKIEAIGGGGSGGNNSGGGGGGGAYAAITNLSLTPGASIPITIGQGGAPQTSYDTAGHPGTGTSFGSYLYADFGLAGQGGGGAYQAPGGQATNCIGTIVYSGGTAGGGSGFGGGGGGGGAAGPIGNGNAGGNGVGGYLGGSGLGGAGDAGFGGSGGSSSVGGAGAEFDASYGSGGGGAGGSAGSNAPGYDGGFYGAGGGGTYGYNSGAPSGAGAQGLIVITYTPETYAPNYLMFMS